MSVSKSSLILISGSFPTPPQSLCMSALIYTLLNIPGNQLQISPFLSIYISLFSGILQTQVQLPPYTLCYITSLRESVRLQIISPSFMIWMYSQVICRSHCKTHFVCFPFLQDHCPPLSDYQCLENVLIHFHPVLLNLTRLSQKPSNMGYIF